MRRTTPDGLNYVTFQTEDSYTCNLTRLEGQVAALGLSPGFQRSLLAHCNSSRGRRVAGFVELFLEPIKARRGYENCHRQHSR